MWVCGPQVGGVSDNLSCCCWVNWLVAQGIGTRIKTHAEPGAASSVGFAFHCCRTCMGSRIQECVYAFTCPCQHGFVFLYVCATIRVPWGEWEVPELHGTVAATNISVASASSTAASVVGQMLRYDEGSRAAGQR